MHNITINDVQLQSLICALVMDPVAVGELDDHNVHTGFLQDIAAAVGQHFPEKLVDSGLSEILAGTHESSVFLAAPDFCEAVARAVCDHCGGGLSQIKQDVDGRVQITVFANDSLSEPDNILSSGAWSFAHHGDANAGMALASPMDSSAPDDSAKALREQHGVWGEHPDVPHSDWQYEVTNLDTVLGYWEYVASKIEMDKDFDESPDMSM